MRGFAGVYRRELAGLFLSPLAWVLLFVTLFFNGVVFSYALGEMRGEVNAALSIALGGGQPFWTVCAILAPLVTMRMISEESRTGILEFLLTAPVGDAAVVLGKACAATTFLALVWASVPFYGLVVHLLGAPPDWGTVATAWLGAVLVSGLFSATGLAASALTGTPLVAAFLAFVLNLLLRFLPGLGSAASARSDATAWALEKVDVVGTYQRSFQTGALDSAHVVFFVAWIGVFLFLAVRLVESRRWL